MGGNAGEWIGRVGADCMAIYGPDPGLIGTAFELWLPNRRGFHFCVRSTPCGRPVTLLRFVYPLSIKYLSNSYAECHDNDIGLRRVSLLEKVHLLDAL